MENLPGRRNNWDAIDRWEPRCSPRWWPWNILYISERTWPDSPPCSKACRPSPGIHPRQIGSRIGCRKSDPDATSDPKPSRISVQRPVWNRRRAKYIKKKHTNPKNFKKSNKKQANANKKLNFLCEEVTETSCLTQPVVHPFIRFISQTYVCVRDRSLGWLVGST